MKVYRKYMVLPLVFIMAMACNSIRVSGTAQENVAAEFYQHDSLQVHMKFDILEGCLLYKGSNIYIRNFFGKDTYHVIVFRSKTPSQWIKDSSKITPEAFIIVGNPIDLIDSFENRARLKTDCSNDGNLEEIVTLKINGHDSRFDYCKTYWDGFEILIAELRKRKIDR